MKSVFVAIGASGKVYMAATKEAAQATLKAADDVGRGTWVEGSNASMARTNEGAVSLDKTLHHMGLRKVPESVLRMSADEAFARLKPVFDLLYDAPRRGRKTPTVFSTTRGLVGELLQANAKLAKSSQKAASVVSYSGPTRFVGLNLLPAGKLFTEFPRWMQQYDANYTSPYWTEMPFLLALKDGSLGIPKSGATSWQGVNALGFCPGSTADCRNSCLVFTGSNKADPYNDVRKAALSAALLYDPEAFVRLIHESIHYNASKHPDMLLMVRLNLLSDIPWEYMAPWLFDLAPKNVLFYDYTKVFARLANPHRPSNYDLTFSFSGSNDTHCERALAMGVRVALAMLMYKPVTKKAPGEAGRRGETITSWVPMHSSSAQDVKPPRFLEMWGGRWRTTDADTNDARPFDPIYASAVADRAARFGLTPPEELWDQPTIGVLRWKTPKGSTVRPETSPFAVKGQRGTGGDSPKGVRAGKEGYTLANPKRESGVSYVTKAQFDPETGYLLVPVTPRQEGVDVAGP
jgi:hypothetical protein